MHKLLLAPVFFLVVGCMSMAGANERGGMVIHVNDRSAAFKLADDNCHKYDRVARISAASAEDKTLTFDCVAP